MKKVTSRYSCLFYRKFYCFKNGYLKSCKECNDYKNSKYLNKIKKGGRMMVKKIKPKIKKVIKAVIYLSQSGISRFLECRKKAKLVIEGWYYNKPIIALRYGKMYHGGLEAITAEYMKTKKKPNNEFINLAMGKLLMEWSKEEQQKIKEIKKATDRTKANLNFIDLLKTVETEVLLIAASLRRYVNYHKSDFNGKKNWISIEKKFEIPYKGITMLGYIDAVYEEGKRYHIFETKTKSRVNPDMVDILHLDFQSFYYIHGFFLATGTFPTGISYNICKKFGSKQKVNESGEAYAERYEADISIRPDFYFVRINASITREEYDDWVKNNLDPLIKDYISWRAGDAPDYCNTTNCDGKYGSCDFLPICAMKDYTNFGKKSKDDKKKNGRK